MRSLRKPHSCRRAMTLFEVVLSLAIFVVAIGAIGLLVTNGLRSSVRSRLQTDAVMRCRSKVAEIIVGATLLDDRKGTFEDDANWHWRSEVNETDTQGLVNLKVTVTRDGGNQMSKISYSLSHLIRKRSTIATQSRLDTRK